MCERWFFSHEISQETTIYIVFGWRYLREVKRVCASVFFPEVSPLGTAAKKSFTKLYTWIKFPWVQNSLLQNIPPWTFIHSKTMCNFLHIPLVYPGENELRKPEFCMGSCWNKR
jgi:hypothetical protein